MNEIKAGPVAVATKALLTLMYGVPILWIVVTSLKSSADVFDRGSTFLFTRTLDACAVSQPSCSPMSRSTEKTPFLALGPG